MEKAPGLRGQGYMLGFVGSGYDAAERMGLIPRPEREQYLISGVTWLTDKGHDAAGSVGDIFYDQLAQIEISGWRRRRRLVAGTESVVTD